MLKRYLLILPAAGAVHPGAGMVLPAGAGMSRLRNICAHLRDVSMGSQPAWNGPTKSSGSLVVTAVESFAVDCPLTAEQQDIMDKGRAAAGTAPFVGFYHTTGVTRIRTSDPSITGFGWAECDADAAAALLVGEDPTAIEALLQGGLNIIDPEAKNTAKKPFIGAENALWDIVGKVYISCHPQVPHAEGSLPS